MVKIRIDKNNFRKLSLLGEELKNNKVSGVELDVDFSLNNCVEYKILQLYLSDFLDYEKYFFISLKNIPFCILDWRSADHFTKSKIKGEKTKECQNCIFSNKCCGFPKGYLAKYGKGSAIATPDLPMEVMIEIEPRCNFSCPVCFNKNSFAKQGRDLRPLNSSYIKKIIDKIYEAGIKIVRFTGGEPMLRNDIYELVKYAKEKGLEVWLNTNGSLLDKKAIKKIENNVSNILIPLHSWTSGLESRLTGFKKAFERKMECLENLHKSKMEVIRIGTIASKESIENFDRLAKIVSKFRIFQWEFYRPISVEGKNLAVKMRYLDKLADNIGNMRKKEKETRFYIANSMPLCAIKDMNKMNSVCYGSFADIGHSRLVIDPRGFIKPHYFIDENVGNPLEILEAWNHPLMKKIRNLEFLPKKCKGCPFEYKCRGGYGENGEDDPLANYGNLRLFKKRIKNKQEKKIFL